MKLALAIALVAACSHPGDDKRPQVERALDAIGDQTAADARAAVAHVPRSRIGVAEIFAEVTPPAVIRQTQTLARFGVTPADLAAVAAAHPDAIDHLLAHAQPALDQLGAAVEALPAIDAADCAALDAKVAVLASGSPADRSYAQMLASGLAACVPCLGSGDHAGCGSPPAAAN